MERILVMMKRYYSTLLLFLLLVPLAARGTRRELSDGWMFRQNRVGEWRAATVPGTVHADLLAHGLIPDPFYRDNERLVQWVDKVNWEYALSFTPDTALLASDHQELTFFGIDTYADVFLNDERVGVTDNMFRAWTFDVKGILRAGENRLLVRLYSPVTRGVAEMERHGLALPASNDYSHLGGMGDVRVSVYTRKAPYHYGWDWGPRLVTSGIWRPVVIEGWDEARVDDLFIRQPEVSAKAARLEAEVTWRANEEMHVEIEVTRGEKVVVRRATRAARGENRLLLPFTLARPRLWWSNGLGDPYLHEFTARVKRDGRVIAERRVSTGIRSLRLVREKDERGESFYFELNGVPVFAKGANVIPGDSFLPRVTRARSERVVEDAARAHMNMLRVWGGGVYEDDAFYEACDRHGIMVWQDFMFACAMYPGDDEFLENVRQEAIYNITRLRGHPCLALWCGNNEIDVAWARWGWQRGYGQAERDRIFAGYATLAHELLPRLVDSLTDGDDYWPSSPMSGDAVNAHELRPATSGDNHYWGVWHESHPFDRFEEHVGRFMSEYGFQSFPGLLTVQAYTLPADRAIDSGVMNAHQRSGVGNRQIRRYMELDYAVPGEFEQFLYLSQVVQAKAIRAAFHAHRRNMPYCMGSLLWQLNDCWPAASWSIIDYYHRWKAAYYAARDACKPVIVAPKAAGETIELWVVNDLPRAFPATWRVELKDFSGRTSRALEGRCLVKARCSGIVSTWTREALLEGRAEGETFAVITLCRGQEVLDEQHLYFTAVKNLLLPPDPRVAVEGVEREGKRFLRVSAEKLALDVFFYLPGEELCLSDNYIDLVPGKAREVEILQPVGEVDVSRIRARRVTR
ncbi:MAG: glycoside hydrolase family 2 protein [Odoribacteraceae bacterium]|nr:glycoside hydrolase family 2 protein [Odoribacteraceae bacterium]